MEQMKRAWEYGREIIEREKPFPERAGRVSWDEVIRDGVRDLDQMKYHVHKIQCVLPDEAREQQLLQELTVLQYEKSGSLMLITARGTKEALLDCVNRKSPVFAEILPLTLEEIFISETEVAGYDIKNLIL